MTAHVAFVTGASHPALTDDDQIAADALVRAGVSVVAAAWSGEVDWDAYDLVVLRSTWDYHQRLAEFERWLSRLQDQRARVANAPAVVRWNLRKSYLRELEGRGVRIPPTVWASKGAAVDLARTMDERGWARAVVKPEVSASAFRTWLVPSLGAGQDQSALDDLLQDSDALIQEFVNEVETDGELSLVFLDGELSHAVRKRPRPGDFRVQNHLGGTDEPIQAAPHVVAAARQALAHVPHPTLYARVDGVVQGDAFVLMELELIEPVLFFRHDPSAASRFAAAVLRQLRGT